MKMSRPYLPEYVKHVHQKVCRTCGRIICPHSTNYVMELWRCVCRSRSRLCCRRPFVAGQLAFIRTFIMILFAFCFHPPSSKKTNQIFFNRTFLSNKPSSLPNCGQPALELVSRKSRNFSVNINLILSLK